jgi:hypothetical protein
VPVLGAGERRVLDANDPVVQLGRVPSGVGGLVGELHGPQEATLAVVYELERGLAGVVRGTGQAPDGLRPVVFVARSRFTLDLRQVGALRRFLVLARASDGPLDGTLVVRPAGAARIEVPLAPVTASPGVTGAPSTSVPGGPGWSVLLSGHVVRGSIVLRAERAVVAGGLRDVAAAYGYGSLTWRDADTVLAP